MPFTMALRRIVWAFPMTPVAALHPFATSPKRPSKNEGRLRTARLMPSLRCDVISVAVRMDFERSVIVWICVDVTRHLPSLLGAITQLPKLRLHLVPNPPA